MFLNKFSGTKIGELNSQPVWKLDKNLIYADLKKKLLIIIPTGFETDLASVPRLPLIYWLFGNTALEAAVLHDYLYCKDSQPVVSKEIADAYFIQAMKETGELFPHRYVMWLGVKFGGFRAYHKRSVKDSICQSS